MKKLLLSIFLNLLCVGVFAQSPYYKTYSVEQGMPQSEIIFGASLIDSSGNIWAGTNGGGLVRLSGDQLTTFTKKDGLPNNLVTGLDFDKEGNLWILTNEGVSRYDGLEFTTYHDKQGILKNTSGVGPTQVLVDNKNNVWINIRTTIFLLKDSVFENVSGKEKSLAGVRFPFISLDSKGGILISTNVNTFLNYENGNFIQLSLPDFPINEGKTLTGGQTLRDGSQFFVATDQATGNLSYHKLQNGEWSEFPLPAYFPPNIISNNLLDHDGNLWISSFNLGVLKYDGTSFQHYSKQKSGLPSNFVSNIFEDHEKNIWVATRGSGLIKIPKAGFINFTQEDGLPGGLVFSTYEDSNGLIWIGTNASGFCTWDGKQLKTYPNAVIRGRIVDFYEEEDGNMLIISRGTGIFRFNGKELKNVNTEFKLPPLASCSDIYKDYKGNLVVSSFANGVLFLDKETKEVQNTITANNGLDTNLPIQVLNDKDGNYWIASIGGVSKFDGEKTTKLTYEGKPLGVVLQIAISNNGDIWAISFDKGLFRVRNDEVTLFDFPDYNTTVFYSITIDFEGNLWMGTQKGILKIEFDTNGEVEKTTEFGLSDGLISVELNGKAAYTDNKGNLWFGHLDGLSKYTPVKKSQNQTPTPTAFTGLKLFFNSVDWGNEKYEKFNSGLTKWSNLPTKLTLPYDQNHLTFEFASLSYTLPERVRRQWKLVGADNDWLPATNKLEATYSNIQPGKYSFKVRSMNNDGVWGEAVEFPFEIEPPIWGTWWFRALVFVIVGGIIFIAIRYRIQALKEQKLELERLVKERTLDLAQKNDEVMLQNAELEQQKEEILTQAEEIETQNKSLSGANEEIIEQNRSITASINYAKRIQESMLPKLKTIKEDFPDSCVLYQPRDTVSGDFYWFEQIINQKGQKESLIAVADCTGHGVPGAFMSMAGDAYLNLAVRGKGLSKPSEILENLDNSISKALKQRTSDSRDGMDIAICKVNKEEKTLEFAGAKNPIIYIQDGKLTQIKGSRHAIGGHQFGKKNKEFETHLISLDKPTTFYLLSDGYADQFGGEKNRKFMIKNLRNLLLEIHKLEMSQQKAKLETELKNWMSGYRQIDDILIMGFKL